MTGAFILIGAVARACGVSDDTVRHYEKRGLITPIERTAAGYRCYSPDVVERIRLIRRALRLGFTLDELHRIFRQRAAGSSPCRQVRALAAQKLHELDEQIAELVALRASLADTLTNWDRRLNETADGQPAHLLETLI
jgi:MerR family copper efflux transcriptional regulator